MASQPSQKPAIDIAKEVAVVVGLIIAIFTLLAIVFPKSLVLPVGTIVIGLILTGILVWARKWDLRTAIITWMVMSLIAVSAYLVISRRATVVGSVIAPNGSPVAGLTLVLTDSDGVDHKAVTDAMGAFEIRNVPDGKFTIVADGELLIGGRVPSGWERIFNPRVPVYDLPYKATALAVVATTAIPPTDTPSPPPATFTPAPTDTSTPSPSPTPECRFDNLVNCSRFVAISIQGESTSTATLISGKLQVSFSNSRSGSGVAFLFAPPLDVKDFRFLELSGTSTHAFTFLVEYKVRGADDSLTIVHASANQSFPAMVVMQTITVPLEYKGAVDEIVLDFPAQDESSLLTIEALRLR